MTTIDHIRAAFPGGQMVGQKWVTRCILPGHDDQNPSLAISVDHGKVLCVCTCNRQSELYAAVMKRLRNDEPTPAKVDAAVKETGWSYSEEKVEAAAKRIELAADFLNSRGISLEVARKHKLGYETIGGREYVVIPTFFEGELVAVKLRALHPISKLDKWKKWDRDKGVYWLYNREAAETASLGDNLYILESELDALTAESAGYFAVSVDSAKHKLNERDLILLKQSLAERIFAPDRDAPGLACALSIAADLEMNGAVGIKWPGKDLGELYAQNPAAFSESLAKLEVQPLWRNRFRYIDELAEGDPIQPIEQILIEGINFIGSLSGVGKTWLALAITKALTTGEPFLGNPTWRVPQIRNVLYLVPEMGDRAFRKRATAMKLPMHDKIAVMTVNDGVLSLKDPLLIQAIQDLNPVIILDTAIRFSTADSENDSRQNVDSLSSQLFNLRREGADCIVPLHHSPKSSSESNFMTLENVLRGSGEFGACADVVWGVQHARKRKGNKTWDDEYARESAALTRLYIQCVKPRDLPAADPFVIQGRPHIDERGNFVVLATDAQVGETMNAETVSESAAAKAEKVAREDPTISKSKLAEETGISRNRIEEVLAGRGLKYVKPETNGQAGRWESVALAAFEESGGEDVAF